MFEAATGVTMVVAKAEDTIALSSRHTSLSVNSRVPDSVQNPFQYANYAEGGACGDTPASKAAFLGTLKDQVDAFESDCRASTRPLGNTLFIIWLGANDLYTAGRRAIEMGQVATQIARTQRDRLNAMVNQRHGRAKFIFVNLARPLSSVRYTQRLQTAKLELAKLGGQGEIEMIDLGRVKSSLWYAQQTLSNATALQRKAKQYGLLAAQIKEIKELERGVLDFNVMLATTALQNGDRVAEIGCCLSEDTLHSLIRGNYRLKEGASGTRAEHRSALSYSSDTDLANLTTIDQVHPTDQVYRLIWLEIYEEIKKSDCTFGILAGALTPTPLSSLSGPSQATRDKFGGVMGELLRRSGN